MLLLHAVARFNTRSSPFLPTRRARAKSRPRRVRRSVYRTPSGYLGQEIRAAQTTCCTTGRVVFASMSKNGAGPSSRRSCAAARLPCTPARAPCAWAPASTLGAADVYPSQRKPYSPDEGAPSSAFQRCLARRSACVVEGPQAFVIGPPGSATTSFYAHGAAVGRASSWPPRRW